MILSRMGRWYEGPSLAEEEAMAEEDTPAEPERRSSEPIDMEAFEDVADTLPLDSEATAGVDRAPAGEEPLALPADSATGP